MPDPNIEILQKETYFKMMENSVGTKLFNSILVRFKDSGKIKDVSNDGMFSCAFFVSGVLYLTHYIDKTNSTVKSLRLALKEKGWKSVTNKPKRGDVVFWELVTFKDGTQNEHVGLALSSTDAVSTSYKKKKVVRHHITFGTTKKGSPKRAITEVLRYE